MRLRVQLVHGDSKVTAWKTETSRKRMDEDGGAAGVWRQHGKQRPAGNTRAACAGQPPFHSLYFAETQVKDTVGRTEKRMLATGAHSVWCKVWYLLCLFIKSVVLYHHGFASAFWLCTTPCNFSVERCVCVERARARVERCVCVCVYRERARVCVRVFSAPKGVHNHEVRGEQ